MAGRLILSYARVRERAEGLTIENGSYARMYARRRGNGSGVGFAGVAYARSGIELVSGNEFPMHATHTHQESPNLVI